MALCISSSLLNLDRLNKWLISGNIIYNVIASLHISMTVASKCCTISH